jgi:site-specific recombinase XerD
MLRTTFGTWMIRAGVDPRTLQEMMGHEDIETTLRHYVGVSYDHMRLVHSQFAKIL